MKGNCLIGALILWLKHPDSKIGVNFQNRHKVIPSFYCDIGEVRYRFRSSPRGNGRWYWYNGRYARYKISRYNRVMKKKSWCGL